MMDKDSGKALEGCSFGEHKGKHVRKHLPVISQADGIRSIFDKWAEEYPTKIRVRMDDGEWITYELRPEMPSFARIRKILENPVWKRGYPPEETS